MGLVPTAGALLLPLLAQARSLLHSPAIHVVSVPGFRRLQFRELHFLRRGGRPLQDRLLQVFPSGEVKSVSGER